MVISRLKRRMDKAKLIKAVASSSAIEIGMSTCAIETKLKSKIGKFKHLTLAT